MPISFSEPINILERLKEIVSDHDKRERSLDDSNSFLTARLIALMQTIHNSRSKTNIDILQETDQMGTIDAIKYVRGKLNISLGEAKDMVQRHRNPSTKE